MKSKAIGILGATSLVGDCLLSSDQINDADPYLRIFAFSRQSVPPNQIINNRIRWCCLTAQNQLKLEEPIDYWISLVPIWVLKDYFCLLKRYGVRRIVVLGSTSLFTKINSSDPKERDVAKHLASGEKQLIEWAERHYIDWIILRPTLIYGLGKDQNITSAAKFIRRFGFFPLLGKATGLRQPVHAKDVATATLRALIQTNIKNADYNISGGEILSYKNMIDRIFIALKKNPRYLPIPNKALHLAIKSLRFLPGFKEISPGMAERMNQDLIFDHDNATQDFGFHPRPFRLIKEDVCLQ